jgi:adenylate cyclase
MKYNILIVDDEQANLRLLERLFSPDYNIIPARSGAAALEVLNHESVALIVTDHRMPGMTGIEFLKRAAVVAPNSVRIVITGYTDADALVDAINSGVVYKYVTKPWINLDLKITMQRALQHYETLRAQRTLQEQYARVVAETDEARSSFRKFVGALLKLHDRSGYERAARINKLAVDLAQAMELPRGEIEDLQLAILMREILSASAPEDRIDHDESVGLSLQASEKFQVGVQAVSEVGFMRQIVGYVAQFDERYDGSGYPDGIYGDNIAPVARIASIASAYANMTKSENDDPSAAALAAAETIRNAAGTKFDPMMVDVFCSMIGAANRTSAGLEQHVVHSQEPVASFV